MRVSPARLWREQIYHYRLVASMCRKCGRKYFPPKVICPNCKNRDMEKIELPKQGTVVTYTVIHTVPRGFREYAPLIIALVKLDDGTKVLAPLTDIQPNEVKIGMRVEATLRKIFDEGSEGLIAYAIKFRPIYE